MPDAGIPRENVVIVSGIGCAARLPVLHGSSYGHALDPRPRAGGRDRPRHPRPTCRSGSSGRATGDLLSIGGNHLLHALRRNVNLKILLLNNRIYGLTKGQYSPTSEVRARRPSRPRWARSTTRSTRSRSRWARRRRSSPARSTPTASTSPRPFRPPSEHRGTLVRRDHTRTATSTTTARSTCSRARTPATRRRSGWSTGSRCARRRGPSSGPPTGGLEVVDGEAPDAVLHDAHAEDPTQAFALSRLASPTPIGVFRSVERPTYGDLMADQLATAQRAASRTPRPCWVLCSRAPTPGPSPDICLPADGPDYRLVMQVDARLQAFVAVSDTARARRSALPVLELPLVSDDAPALVAGGGRRAADHPGRPRHRRAVHGAGLDRRRPGRLGRGPARRGVTFTRYDGMEQDSHDAWTAPGGDQGRLVHRPRRQRPVPCRSPRERAGRDRDGCCRRP